MYKVCVCVCVCECVCVCVCVCVWLILYICIIYIYIFLTCAALPLHASWDICACVCMWLIGLWQEEPHCVPSCLPFGWPFADFLLLFSFLACCRPFAPVTHSF